MNLFTHEHGGLTMIPYRLDYTIEKLTKTGPSMERTLLRIYTGDDLSEKEARGIWKRIADHKWHLSETLNRDVGFHVATVDYVEHFYEPNEDREPDGWFASIWKSISLTASSAARNYFEAKGRKAVT
jgi:hypothetical protein